MIRHRDASGPNRLRQAEAATRAARIDAVEYDVALSLQAGRAEYEGDVTIRFQHTAPAEDTFLDFTGAEILRLVVNDAEREEECWEANRLQLRGGWLREQNIVRVVYRNRYDQSGVGLHRFLDPEDGQEYLYTQFEPYEAHRLFPCFDQPDLKARYRLRVAAPSAWRVVSNYPERASGAADGERTVREFQATERFSPYLFALVAGPFQQVVDRHEAIPLGVYCRASLAKHLDAEELFTITKQGLGFLSEFFDFPYPYPKYDQLFVPEFNFGAMENVGCITFSERMIFRDPPTELQRLNRAEVILHEMAHMWFGDLVTMRWWNDLWLNESFATYLAALTLHGATRFREGAWPAFHSRMKAWAYEQDQLVTTHPISGEVPDTDATFLNFDGITYGKGAAALKQLAAAIGPERFREGTRRYFRRYAWGNTTLREFLGALEEGAERDLGEWSQLWLEREGCNTLAPGWEASAGVVERFWIDQSAPPEHPTLRPHHLELAVFDLGEEGEPVLRRALPLAVEGARSEVAGLVGTAEPTAVFPNYGDHAFAKITLDERSLAYVRENLEQFDDTFLRLQLWHTLWEMVRDQRFRSPDYLALVRAKLPLEGDLELCNTVLGNAGTALARYLPEERRLAEAQRLFALCWEQLFGVAGQDFRIIWARALIAAAQEPEAVGQLLTLADAGTGLAGFELDQDMRWSLVIKAAAYDLPGAAERLEAESARDPSDRGKRAAETARSAQPDAATKAAAWRRFREDRDSSLHSLRAAMRGFPWIHQRDLLAEYVERFFVEVEEVFAERDKDFATAYFGALYPSYLPTAAVIGRTAAAIAALPGEEQGLLRRQLREAQDEMQRARAGREFAAT